MLLPVCVVCRSQFVELFVGSAQLPQRADRRLPQDEGRVRPDARRREDRTRVAQRPVAGILHLHRRISAQGKPARRKEGRVSIISARLPTGPYARGGARGLAPNGCMVSTTNNIIVSKEAILSAENSGKPLGGRGSALNPTGEPTALSQTPWWEGVVAPSQELPHRSRPSASAPSQMKSPRHALDYPWLRFVLCLFICAF